MRLLTKKISLLWQQDISSFLDYLEIERSLSSKTLEAYRNDIFKLAEFATQNYPEIFPSKLESNHINEFILNIDPVEISARSQARIISGIRAFFKFLLISDAIDINPAKLVESPRTGQTLPNVLSLIEIDAILSTVDLSKPDGYRNRAIIEMLYSCGLRVSELTELRITNLHFEEGYITICGKGNKERLVPVSGKAARDIQNYFQFYRQNRDIKKGQENYVFLNHRGSEISRTKVFTIVKEMADEAGIKKNISPHTFRHSFATHLVEGGADLVAVKEMLGHESIITTEIYSHLNRDYLHQELVLHHPRAQQDTMNFRKPKTTNE